MGGGPSSGLPHTAAGNRTRIWSFVAQLQWLHNNNTHAGREGASRQRGNFKGAFCQTDEGYLKDIQEKKGKKNVIDS